MNNFKYNDPFLFFEFAGQNGQIEPLHFKEPAEVISTSKVEEVLPCLKKVQEAAAKGFYAAGYLSYEAAPAFEPAFAVHPEPPMPLLWFGIFKEPVPAKPEDKGEEFHISSWKPLVDRDRYGIGIERIKAAIENGDTYQVNYTIRLEAEFKGDPYPFYKKLAKAQASKYSAYLHTGKYSILSASPELFFRWDGKELITRPMKGTIKRGLTLAEDRRNEAALKQSKKDQAENVMIVDLLRNDAGSIAEPGSVEVSSLFEIEKYPTVLQMTSEVAAKTLPGTQLTDIFSALFPCGSITGAPKISTMQIINQLEELPREVYCGAIGYISPEGEAVFNVPIRTVIADHEAGKARYGVGGGITWDSSAEGEYHEILAKSALLTEERPDFKLLESLRLENGQYYLLERHLERIGASAEYFDYSFSREGLVQCLAQFAKENPSGVMKVRVLLGKEGNTAVEGAPLTGLTGPVKVEMGRKPIHSKDIFLYHKTTNRNAYHSHQSSNPKVFDVLLWNEKEELTEFTIGNAVFEIDGNLWTPPVSAGLLAGTMREELLSRGEIKERTITKEDLPSCTQIWLINSVRGWVPVKK